jgi:hypothetical protein
MKISLAITLVAVVLLLIGSDVPDRSVAQKVIGAVVVVLIFPAGLIMGVIFPGPPHHLIVPITMIVLTFLVYTVFTWVVLVSLDIRRGRNRDLNE